MDLMQSAMEKPLSPFQEDSQQKVSDILTQKWTSSIFTVSF